MKSLLLTFQLLVLISIWLAPISSFAQMPTLDSYCTFAQDYSHDWVDFREQMEFSNGVCSKPLAQEKTPAPSDPRLNEAEQIVLIDYVNSGYDYMNAQAKNPTFVGYSNLIPIMDSALNKLPNYRGIVYEGIQDTRFAQMKPGQIITSKGYLSTSKSIVVARNFSHFDHLDGVVFMIHIKNGKDLSETFNAPESEVLVPRNAKFRILRHTKKLGNDVIEVEQLGDFPYEKPPIRQRLKQKLKELLPY